VSVSAWARENLPIGPCQERQLAAVAAVRVQVPRPIGFSVSVARAHIDEIVRLPLP